MVITFEENELEKKIQAARVVGYSLEEKVSTLRAKTLCASCTHGVVFKREGPEAEIQVHCCEMGKSVPPDIVECSKFVLRGTLTIHDMGQIALMVDPRQGTNDKSYL